MQLAHRPGLFAQRSAQLATTAVRLGANWFVVALWFAAACSHNPRGERSAEVRGADVEQPRPQVAPDSVASSNMPDTQDRTTVPPRDESAAAPIPQSEDAVRAWVLKTHHGIPPKHLTDAELEELFNRLATADSMAMPRLRKEFRESLYAMESAEERKHAIEQFNNIMSARSSGEIR